MEADIPAVVLGACDKGGLFLELRPVAETLDGARSVAGASANYEMIGERKKGSILFA